MRNLESSDRTRNFSSWTTTVLVALLLACGFHFDTANAAYIVQDNASSASAQDAEMQKALKYHKALQRRPNPGYLYDRFYNSWLGKRLRVELMQR